MWRSTSYRSGFTLIELLVVIAIIALLSAILFPVFAKAREKARQASCASNLKQLGLGIFQYTQDYDDVMPWGYGNDGNQVYTSNVIGRGWANQVYPYINSKQVFVCPDDYVTARDSSHDVVSYAYNSNLAKTQGPRSNGLKSGTLSQFTAPTKTVLLSEIRLYYNPTFTVQLTVIPLMSVWTPVNDAPATFGTNPYASYSNGNNIYFDTGPQGINPPVSSYSGGNISLDPQFLTGRHADGSNYALSDGHVKWLPGARVSPGVNNNDPNCQAGLYDNQYTGPCSAPDGAVAAGTEDTEYTATYSAE